MKRKHYSIDQLSTETARKAQAEAAAMQSALKKLRGNLNNVRRNFSAPTVRSKRTWTKRKVTTLSPILRAQAGIFDDFLSSSLLDALGGTSSGGWSAFEDKIYMSEAQTAGRTLAELLTGQRIR